MVGVILSTSLVGWGFQQARYTVDADRMAALELPVDTAPLEALDGQVFDSDLAFKAAVADAIGAEGLRDHSASLIQAAIDVDARVVLAGILGFVFFFALSLGPVMWVLFSEIFPNRVRGMALAVTGLANSLSSFLVQFLFPWELSTLGVALTFFVFSGIGLLFLVPIWRLLPETRGRSLEQVETLMTGEAAPGRTP
jgi:MFS family permease